MESLTAPAAAREGEWSSRLAVFVAGLLLFETISGLSIWLLPFSVPNQFSVLLHTLGGLLFLVPFLIYQTQHWLNYRSRAWSHYLLTGYVAFAAVTINAVSGVILTVQGLLATRISYFWDMVHIVTTVAIVAFLVPHIVIVLIRDRQSRAEKAQSVLRAERNWVFGVLGITVVGYVILGGMTWFYQPTEWANEFPADYEYDEEIGPFRPSLATTASGGAYDDRSLTGSASCGSAGCHEQIYDEWAVSAHSWSSKDPAFQAIQNVMAQQNGPQSTRYCGGCHDPASLFAGTKNVFAEDLSSVRGHQEGVSCLVCHSIRETDLKGNANYTIVQPERYIYETEEGGSAKLLSDFLIRTYPKKHIDVFAKRLFKTPEYCAACHKQFIDQEVNKVGWVQLQNQYDNWRKSKWNPEGEPDKVVECRECHMPLQESNDPASGDELDSYRFASDGKHRDHRFIGANSFVPQALQLENAAEHTALTEAWLRGERPIPEIEYKWAAGPAVGLELECPDTVQPGEDVKLRVVITSNKVGHDFPTGPLDIIQSWINVEVTDDNGEVVFASGHVDEKHFIEPGSFMFKAEPVDRYGNLIDRHNLWEMVGVRYRRAIFPGFSDAASYAFACPAELAEKATAGEQVGRDFEVATPYQGGSLHVKAHLDYRKADQYLLNFIFGEDSGITAPVIRMASTEKTIRIEGT
jgi:hypothetical protein